MGDVKDIRQAIETRLLALDFIKAKQIFDFNEIPNSVLNKSFRIEHRVKENRYIMTNLANPKIEFLIFIAYKKKRDLIKAEELALDDRETIEKDLINHSSIRTKSDAIFTMEGDASTTKEFENYLVSRIVFTADIIRNIAST